MAASKNGKPKVELRGDIDRDIIDVLDAVSAHLRISRMEMTEKILRHWADEKLMESRIVVRVMGSKGSTRAGGGTEGE